MEARQEAARGEVDAPFHRGLYACTGTRRRRCVERMCVRVWLCGALGWLVREGAEGTRATSRILCHSTCVARIPLNTDTDGGRQACGWRNLSPCGLSMHGGTRGRRAGGGGREGTVVRGERLRRMRRAAEDAGEKRESCFKSCRGRRPQIRMVQIRVCGEARGRAGRVVAS